MKRRLVVLYSFLLLTWAGCASRVESPVQGSLPSTPTSEERVSLRALPVEKYIKHVIIVVQEGRSFDNLFAGWPGADAPKYAFERDGLRVPLREVGIKTHAPGTVDWRAALSDFNAAKMNGFPPDADAYVKHADIMPYRAMAKEYVLADHMFPTEFGGAFTADLDLISGTTKISPSASVVDFPSKAGMCDAPPGTVTNVVTSKGVYEANVGPFPCFTQFRTMADTLDAAQISWKSYSAVSGLDPWNAIRNVPPGHISIPETNILADISKGTLPAVSWIWPKGGSETAWSARLVNAVGMSPAWGSTVVLVVWDDWGDWYDNAAPPALDATGLGIRVPLIIVSPYARSSYVSHTQYEFGSILKFVEQVYHLPPLGPSSAGYTDTRANSLLDSFNFAQAPRTFKPIPR